MREYVIYNKMIILFYCACIYIHQSNYNWSISFFLIYIILNFSIEIIKHEKAKIILNLLSIALTVLFSTRYDFNIYLVIVNIYDINFYLKKQSYLDILALFLVCYFIPKELLTEFLLISLLSYLNFFLYMKSYKKIKKLFEENYDLKQKNYNLNKKITINEKQESYNLYMSQLEERNKISQEIHDKIGHMLAGNIMQLEACKILIEKDKKKCEILLNKSIASLRDGLEQIRKTVRNIKPATEQLGITKIETIINDFIVKTNIDTKLILKGDLSLVGYGQWKIMQDSLEECFTNIIKYSKATKVRITIEELNKYIKFNIKDNGIGCIYINKGIGLRGIEERCEDKKGKLIVDGMDGFSVIILLPKNNIGY